jgi:hypothetical protein
MLNNKPGITNIKQTETESYSLLYSSLFVFYFTDKTLHKFLTASPKSKTFTVPINLD